MSSSRRWPTRVFVSGYVDALKQTMVLPIGVLALTAFSALLITRYERPAAVEQEDPASEQIEAAS